jgi:hypothetical protein
MKLDFQPGGADRRSGFFANGMGSEMREVLPAYLRTYLPCFDLCFEKVVIVLWVDGCWTRFE